MYQINRHRERERDFSQKVRSAGAFGVFHSQKNQLIRTQFFVSRRLFVLCVRRNSNGVQLVAWARVCWKIRVAFEIPIVLCVCAQIYAELKHFWTS